MAEPLRRSTFLVYDQLHQDESSSEGEIILYYWPPDLPTAYQFFIQGGTMAALSLISDIGPMDSGQAEEEGGPKKSDRTSRLRRDNLFESSQPTIFLKLQKNKFAVKKEDPFVFVLSSEISEPDASLGASLDIIYEAFRFYHHGPTQLLEKNKDKSRRDLMDDFKRAFDELLPLLTDSTSPHSVHSHTNISLSNSTGLPTIMPRLAFNTLPYAQLPTKSNRLYIQASQILDRLSTFTLRTNETKDKDLRVDEETKTGAHRADDDDNETSEGEDEDNRHPSSHKGDIVMLDLEGMVIDDGERETMESERVTRENGGKAGDVVFGSLLCHHNRIVITQLDDCISRFILNKIMHIRNTTDIRRSEDDWKTPHWDRFNVYVSSKRLKSLLGQEKYDRYKDSMRADDTEEQMVCGLYILTYSTIAIATLVAPSAIQDPSFLASLSKVSSSFEKQFRTRQVTQDCGVAAYETYLNRSFRDHSPTHRLVGHRSHVNHNISLTSSGTHLPLLSSSSVNLNHTNICTCIRVPWTTTEEPSTYHYLYYDGLVHTMQATGQSTTDGRFLTNTNYARSMFMENSNLSQILLQDIKSGIYCRRMMDKELYFQPNSTNPHDVFMKYIDQTREESCALVYPRFRPKLIDQGPVIRPSVRMSNAKLLSDAREWFGCVGFLWYAKGCDYSPST
ncbi:hypothetical protein PROFUN_13788 [Planoprotostelium fungivorum]|uniref:CCZ1/INTU/HSP4 first Longin domain-containing protein n=1 Tax=Planoprotostelium fungivorum TaxID=1890364 RepID=A0A2P6N333_9EUKA|nr:hypothetical protein PROFUN_13788 [Planoprotostelium fungivorum]